MKLLEGGHESELQTSNLTKDKYNVILKSKEDEIKKLTEEKNFIKDNEAKKYEKIFSKYELTLKLRESEIENLKVKIKKLESSLALKK
jgi:hypothetical protein